MDLIFGIDIGGTKTSVTYASKNEPGVILGKKMFDTGTQFGPEYTMNEIIESIDGLCDVRSIYAIGISCGGPLNSRSGTILGPPNLPGWNDIQIVTSLENRFGVRAFLQNDADACALAEWKIGAGRGCCHMVFLTFGTGLGAGLILNSRLYSGACGMAGEAGHVRLSPYGPAGYGKAGSFEGFCSGGGIVQLARTVLHSYIQTGRTSSITDGRSVDKITARDVFAAAHAGDAAALEIVSVVGEQLGKGLSILIDILNPERIVIGSIYQRNHVLLRPYLERVLEKEALGTSRQACEIVPAALGDSLGDYAAILTAVYGMEEEKR